MKGIGRVLAAALLLALGCEQSHQAGSSGSNWLRCETLADCGAAADAMACDEGFCVDDDGDRIAVIDVKDSGAAPKAEAGPDARAPEPSDASVREPCAWGADALLNRVGADVGGRANCGLFGTGSSAAEIAAARECFESAVSAAIPVEITISNCTDCWIPTTYVATAAGERFAVLMAQDHFSANRLREAKVEACDDIVVVEASEIIDLSCVAPNVLYACTEPLDAPLAPYKLADVPMPPGENGVSLHLYVSNQSFERPLAEINVYLDGAYVVTGDFDVGSQHNWHEFEIAVPPGSLSLRAIMPEGSAELDQQIEVPAERWAVLNYWFYPDEPAGEHFTLTLHDQRPLLN